jgi:hypothetical protein|nr:MAG TPA: hypothetical protein [Caudoviricetes sp.]
MDDRFAHLTDRQKSACYFIMSTLGVYLKDNETAEGFLNKYLVKAKIKAGWKNPYKKADGYTIPKLSLEVINKCGVSECRKYLANKRLYELLRG